MTKRALKLPDGGTLDLPIPEGFGSATMAEAKAPLLSANAMRWVGYGLAVAAVFMFWKSTTLKVS